MNEYQKIGIRIKQLRLSKQLSQSEMADALGISRSLIAQIERSNTKPTLELLYKLVRYCNTSYDYLIEGKDIYSNQMLKVAEPPVIYSTKQVQKEVTLLYLKNQIDIIIDRLDRNDIK